MTQVDLYDLFGADALQFESDEDEARGWEAIAALCLIVFLGGFVLGVAVTIVGRMV